jgi:methionyl-tRNA formyltransferase
MRVVFFGTPRFAVPTLGRLLASSHAVCGIVTQPDRPRGRGQKVSDAPVKAAALVHTLPLMQPTTLTDTAVEEMLRSWAPDIGVVVAYGQLIPTRLLALPRHGLINVHASLLPAYRGAAPIHRAVLNGDAQTGISIMRVAPRLDAGAVFATAVRAIGPDETSDVVEAALAVMGADLLVTVVDAIAEGTAVEVPQDDTRATYAKKLQKAESPLDWTRPAAALHNQVRGLHSWPLASTTVRGARVIVLESAPVQTEAIGEPGVVVRVDRDHLHVAAGAGTALALLRVQPEGRRPMPIRDFLAGNAPRLDQPLSDV